MESFGKITALRFIGVLMCIGILLLCLLIHKDFSSTLYEEWGRALANSLAQFEHNLAGR